MKGNTIPFNGALPQHPRPIFIIGSGGIVNDAHLPAYQLAGFPVAGIFDIDREKALATANKFNIPIVFSSLDEMLKNTTEDTVFDLALPGNAIIPVLKRLPQGAVVLIQKPMGNNLADAREIVTITREKKMIAGVNFQLRYAPFINTTRNMIRDGMIGDLCDIEINVNVYTPWHLWSFLYSLPRVEILYHSIHYVDLIRSFLGNPQRIYAKTVKHPAMKALASVRTSIIMDYGDMIRANILTNHVHHFGLHNQQAGIKMEGTKGAIRMGLGVLMDYPHGVPDNFEYALLEDNKIPKWKTLPIEGSWFPHAFIGSMAQVMLAAEGSISRPDNSVEDCIDTMACVEAAYESSEIGGIKMEKYFAR